MSQTTVVFKDLDGAATTKVFPELTPAKAAEVLTDYATRDKVNLVQFVYNSGFAVKALQDAARSNKLAPAPASTAPAAHQASGGKKK